MSAQKIQKKRRGGCGQEVFFFFFIIIYYCITSISVDVHKLEDVVLLLARRTHFNETFCLKFLRNCRVEQLRIKLN